MINQEQSREYTRCTKLNQFLQNNEAVYNSFEPFKTEATSFSSNLQTFSGLIPDKNHVTTGITADKNGLKQKLADALGLICRKTYSYALTYNNPDLAAQVNTRADKIFRMRDTDISGFAQSIKKIAAPLLANADYVKYGVTAAKLDAIITDATAFNDMIGKANVTGSGNAVANVAIDKTIGALRLNIKHFDLLVDEFEETNPAFVEGYYINSEVGNTGIRHSGIEGYVRSKSGDAISSATVHLANTTKSAVTDLKGYYHLDRVRPDDYMVECSAGGYAPQSKLHHISRGKTDEMDWEM